MADDKKITGSFFNSVPDDDDDDSKAKPSETETDGGSSSSSVSPSSMTDEEVDMFDKSLQDVLKKRREPLASQPSTIGGLPTSKAKGFAKKQQQKQTPEKPYVPIGTPDKPLNDPTKPEVDDQGYTIYTNEQTGEKKRVFEALVDYPCLFKVKIVGANEGAFASEMVAMVAECCKVGTEEVPNSSKTNGKWISVTVDAPVDSAEMLYLLYETIDRDPRVKFKF